MKNRSRYQTYAFVIGHTEDFGNTEEVIDYISNRPFSTMGDDRNSVGGKRAAFYTFKVPKKMDESIVVLVGRGIAFSDGWERDTTFSCVINKEGV